MARILIAEDEDNIRTFVARALSLKGHHVTDVADGGLAAEALADNGGEYDLLLSDIRMPVMDGIALALDTAVQYPGLKILLMTGFADQQERAHGLEALIHDVIPKPFTLDILVDKVDEALSGRPAEIVPLAVSGLN
jgi:two-component system, cell cycle response regulator CpdR